MKTKKTSLKKHVTRKSTSRKVTKNSGGVRPLTLILFFIFLVVSVFCIKTIREVKGLDDDSTGNGLSQEARKLF